MTVVKKPGLKTCTVHVVAMQFAWGEYDRQSIKSREIMDLEPAFFGIYIYIYIIYNYTYILYMYLYVFYMYIVHVDAFCGRDIYDLN